jgi:hypothetical protein
VHLISRNRNLAAVVMLLAACASARSAWNWHPKEGAFDERKLSEDVAVCEEQTRVSESRGPVATHRAVRPWGGWGNHVFDACMDRQGWVLKRGEVPGEAATELEKPPAAAGAPAAPAPAADDGTTQL